MKKKLISKSKKRINNKESKEKITKSKTVIKKELVKDKPLKKKGEEKQPTIKQTTEDKLLSIKALINKLIKNEDERFNLINKAETLLNEYKGNQKCNEAKKIRRELRKKDIYISKI